MRVQLWIGRPTLRFGLVRVCIQNLVRAMNRFVRRGSRNGRQKWRLSTEVDRIEEIEINNKDYSVSHVGTMPTPVSAWVKEHSEITEKPTTLALTNDRDFYDG